MIKVFCNQCGKEIGLKENRQTFDLTFGYGSDFDGKTIHIDLHEGCLDSALYNMMKDFKLQAELEDGFSDSYCDGNCENCDDGSDNFDRDIYNF
jgi:hypothetical protein